MKIKVLLFLLLVSSLGVHAEDKFPNKPISMIVPFPPGGVADIVARALVPAMEKKLGQPVVVLNKPGSGGSLGTAFVANAKPDGYTLLMALSSISTNPEQERLNNKPAAFQLNQLAPLARITKEDMMLAVKPDSLYRTFGDFLADAKRRPGAVSYASSGVYGVYHVATEMFADAAGITLLHAAYSGGPPALMALLSGQVDVGLLTRSVGAPHLASGKLRPIAAWGDSRWPDYATVPSLKEAGYDVQYTLWSGIFSQASLPKEIAQTLGEAIKQAVADPAFKTAMTRVGATIYYLDGAEFRKYWEQDASHLNNAIRKIGTIR